MPGLGGSLRQFRGLCPCPWLYGTWRWESTRALGIRGPFCDEKVQYIILDNGEKLYRPQEPAPGDCCGKGCAECIWTIFLESRRHYDGLVAELRGKPRELTVFEILEMRLAKEADARKAKRDT